MVTYLADYTGFDWYWEPPPWQSHQRHAWASQWQKDSGTYLIPREGWKDTHYHAAPVVIRTADQENWHLSNAIIEPFDFSWHPDPTEPPMIYQFGTQHQATGGPQYRSPGAKLIKYVEQPRATKINVDSNWSIPDGLDGKSFDWTWHPDDRDPPFLYQFGTQHQRTGGPRYTVTGATDVKFVDQIRIRNQRTASAVYLIDHMDGHRDSVLAQANVTRVVRYFDNYLDTLRRIAKNASQDEEFVWIISSVCDYDNFDFSWHPEQWQSGMLHVFPSDGLKFGDTFFMHVPTFRDRSDACQLLEWYDINFLPDHQSVARRPLPMVIHDYDSHVDTIKTYTGTEPLTVFANRDPGTKRWPAVNLWREEVKTVVPLDAGAGVVIIPKAAVPYIRSQIYDYPHIDKTCRNWMQAPPLDVVFISNSESNADANWDRLQEVLHVQRNRLHRVTGVDGRVAAYQAAARESTTPWFFAVFAKLHVSDSFDWSWQPDRMQQPKHYIFHARNPVNDLEYGHQAMIAYNRRMTLENTGQGLDFTLDQPHEVVPILSGVANYADTAWSAWRTAFREAIKLRHSLPDVESEYRLNRWMTQGHGRNGEFSVLGAQDAMTYYDTVDGDFAELRKTYEWSWLSSYAMLIRPQVFTQSNT